MVRTIRTSLAAAACSIIVSFAAEAAQPFDAKAFQAAQQAGSTIVIDVTADWCPTCRSQKPIIEGLEKQHPRLVVYDVDFDTAKDVLRRFHVQYQSTLIVFKGAKEVGRSVGDTNPVNIWTMVEKGL